MLRFIRSVGYALSGIGHAFVTQRHMRFHCFSAVVVAAAGIYFKLSRTEWAWIAIATAAVIAAELFNTAIENIVDLASPERHPLAKSAKDSAAGAVLVLAGAAVVIGLLVIGPHVWQLLNGKG